MQPGDQPIRREILSWKDVDKLVDVLLGQLRGAGPFDAMIMITRGGVVPGGLLSEALDVKSVLTASVRFPEVAMQPLAAWPEFLQFPQEAMLSGRRVLIVDDVWGKGRTMTSVTGLVERANATPATCVFHFNPYRSLFGDLRPDYYGAVTDAFIVYPWEIDRDIKGLPAAHPDYN